MDNNIKNNINFDKFIDEFLEKEKINNKKFNIMKSNTEYLIWLEKFTNKYPNFSDEDWLYHPEKISEEDLKNVNDLNILYEIIECYATENYIYPTKYKFGNSYKIKLDNKGYEIGELCGQGTIYFCNKINVENELDFIDYNNIINNIKINNEKHIKKTLKSLSKHIESVNKKRISLEEISITCNKPINKIKKL